MDQVAMAQRMMNKMPARERARVKEGLKNLDFDD